MELTLETTREAAERTRTGKVYGHFIDGQWVESDSGETIPQENPATHEVLAHIQAGNAVDVNRAVEAAARAFPKWSQSPAIQRQFMLRAIAARIRERQFDYAMMETLNNGKPISDAYSHDIPGAMGQFEYFSGAAFHIYGQTHDFPDATALVHREAIGVVAQIIPWNAPLMMAAIKLAPALAAGCTIVLKPAEVACLSVMAFIEDIADIVPPGVINVVTGYGSVVGEPLVSHPKVRKVAFTGSRPTAQKIIGYAAKNIIPQTMELGGKSANIICEDADIEAAAQSAVITTVFNKGEVCVAGTRVFVHEKVEDKFLEAFARRLAAVRQGDPVDPATQLGAMASKAQFDKVSGYLELGAQEGARAFFGGKPARIQGLEDGYFIEPTIFSDVRNDMRIAQEEIFGPVTSVIRWKDEDEMLKLVNGVEYGLAGGLWTQDLTRAHRISRAMETGVVWVNRYYNFKPGLPGGGYKQSGFGREMALATLDHYTVTKSVVINLAPNDVGENFVVAAPNATT
ncbi:acyl-CoA reductase-like NAD-dependent aldehyde dehydrogenase [Sphingobium xenophagum]|uniref:Acyl-CoA reductase-like NAD-dependent aldehyde dehydrogenase n=1 Tax=Sphingobium xenophagum TaxID=121428 RepID=A0ABU1X2M3_SPHXE|nr:aldehyde dehydrogenase family protein [Sphingobium xenophagum]MDR7155714.1 acyl-CoA reductase-like NAD-dependent aldehyde dehydrogenase [Sphingobium xenophagum]